MNVEPTKKWNAKPAKALFQSQYQTKPPGGKDDKDDKDGEEANALGSSEQ